jgi:hypothetical protein
MRAITTTSISLDEPDVDGGLVTWLEVRIEAENAEDAPVIVGRARAARVHVVHALEVGECLADVLDADSAELEALYGVYFDGDHLRDEYTEGVGSDLLYMAEAILEPGWEDRGIELAVVRRLCDTLGEGCELAIVPDENDGEAKLWEKMGFAISTPGEREGLMHT